MSFDKRNFLILLALLYNLIILPSLFANRVEGNSLFGTSFSYGILVVAAVSVVIFYLGLWFFREAFYAALQKISSRLLLFLIIAPSIGIFYISLTGIQGIILQFILLNWVLFSWICLIHDRGHIKDLRLWYLGFFLLIAFCLLILFLNALTERPYSPDEAIWADVASSLRVTGNLYPRTSYGTPFAILPGVGWANALYGEMQWLFDWDLRVGRLFNFLAYSLGILGIAWVSHLLYGRTTAVLTIGICIASGVFFKVADYRPDHFLPIVQSFSFAALIIARQSQARLRQILGHLSAGLLVTLGMQVHAASITFAIGLSIFYVADFVWTLWKSKKLSSEFVVPIASFGIGAAMGTAVYYVANILAVGGLQMFLGSLIGSRSTGQREFSYLFAWTMLERLLLLVSIGYTIWRRQSIDKFYLALVASSMIGIFIADTQGYIIPYRGLFLPVMARFCYEFFYDAQENRRFVIITSILLLASFFQVGREGIVSLQNVWAKGGIPEAQIEIIGRDIVAELEPSDEVIIGTHELLWVMADYPNLYSPMAEGLTMKEFGWGPEEVWQRIQADVYIEIAGRLVTPEGLQAYLNSEGFAICESIRTFGYEVNFYRRSCD